MRSSTSSTLSASESSAAPTFRMTLSTAIATMRTMAIAIQRRICCMSIMLINYAYFSRGATGHAGPATRDSERRTSPIA